MTDLQVALSSSQQEILLRGLRFVRSAVALDMLDYTDQIDSDRRAQYAQISELEAMINGRTAELSSAR